MTRTRPLKLLRNALIGFVLVSGVLLLGVRCAGRVPRVAVGAGVPSIMVAQQAADGTPVRVEVQRDDAAAFQKLEAYLLSLSGRAGSFSLTPYIPGVVITAPRVEVNFGGGGLVISTRSEPSKNWTQRVVDLEPHDEEMRRFAEELLRTRGTFSVPGTP